MSTTRLQKGLKQLAQLEQEVKQIPDNPAIKQEKVEFLKRAQQLRKDISQKKGNEVLLSDLNSVEEQYIKLAEMEFAIGKEVLEKQIEDYVKNLPDTNHMQKQLNDLQEKVKVFNPFKKETDTSKMNVINENNNKTPKPEIEKPNHSEKQTIIKMRK